MKVEFDLSKKEIKVYNTYNNRLQVFKNALGIHVIPGTKVISIQTENEERFYDEKFELIDYIKK